MGKASTWIKNFLMGKREDKYKKLDTPILAETHYLDTPFPNLPPATPKSKRRWSFRRTTSNKATTHNVNRSFDSIYMPRQDFLEYYTQHKVLPVRLSVHAAATRIQAAYRSYLARRALRALKALVKLQALARGHLVRKQTKAVMRSMHAILAIQVRARINRAQVAEEASVKVEYVSSERSQQMRGAFRSRSVRYDTLAERAEHGHTRQNSGRLSFSQRECPPKMPPSPSTSSFTDSSSTTYDGQLEEVSYRMEQRNSKRHYAWPENKQASVNPIMQYSDHATSNSQLAPNYMTKTESSKAKVRSESEPRQRPKIGRKQKSRRTSSMDGKTDKEDQYSWMIKLYRSSNFMNDGDSNSSINAMTRTSIQKSLMPFEPPVSLY